MTSDRQRCRQRLQGMHLRIEPSRGPSELMSSLSSRSLLVGLDEFLFHVDYCKEKSMIIVDEVVFQPAQFG